MPHESFQVRNGLQNKLLITNDFPYSARVGLVYIIDDLLDNGYLQRENNNTIKYSIINREISRLSRDLTEYNHSEINPLIMNMDWKLNFELMERIYLKILKEICEYDMNGNVIDVVKNISEVRNYYSEEVNTLLNEESIGFEFVDGLFMRKGYLKTIKSIAKSNTVLSDPDLAIAKNHYNKAIQYFSDIKNPDFENCIKESICALEFCLERLYSKEITKNFENGIRKLGQEKKVPAPIIESIIKMYGYRNNANGVAHGTGSGLIVSEKEAELVISLIADYITYFYSLLKTEEELIPF